MEKDILNTIANKLHILRKENNITQKDLCNKLNINRNTYANWENARTEIPLENLDMLAINYDVSIDYFFGFNENKKEKYQKMSFSKLAKNLNSFKKENNIKLDALAIDAGTTSSTIWAYLNNKTKIHTCYLYGICKNNNISADYLLGKIDTPKYLNSTKK